MGVLEVVFLGIALSMDAVAVSMTNGMTAKKLCPRHALLIALFFGVFQALMPLVGYFIADLVASNFVETFEKISSIIAFVLLGFLGGKMIFDCVRGMIKAKKGVEEECDACFSSEKGFSIFKLLMQAVATSIDALAVGITLKMAAMTEQGLALGIFGAVGVIGAITFALSLVAVYIGKALGNKLADKAGVFGGAVLVIIGVKLLLEGIL
ncbi:MAG: manganese efflux pump [Clostridia bacterium]|nr:manganese efflux pump [Clostridia bacterium]